MTYGASEALSDDAARALKRRAGVSSRTRC